MHIQHKQKPRLGLTTTKPLDQMNDTQRILGAKYEGNSPINRYLNESTSKPMLITKSLTTLK